MAGPTKEPHSTAKPLKTIPATGMQIPDLTSPELSHRYQIIYADPPWQYRDRGIRSGTRPHYRTMRLDELAGLPVRQVAASDSWLFLWCTMPMLDRVHRVIDAWGFTYKTAGFVWVKTTKAKRPAMGCGHYTRANAELCLLSIRGRPARVSRSVGQIVLAPRSSHSQKPDDVRGHIVELCGDVPRIELFAREAADGWDAWGDGLGAEHDGRPAQGRPRT